MGKNKSRIFGYSERGIFNSIIYYLDSKPELIGKFLEKLGVDRFNNGEYDFTFLNEQSFSDFGDSDLTIIVKQNESDEKPRAVIFVEGKVKTYSGKYSLEKEFVKIKNAIEKKETFNGFSSNIFVQLYYKYLLQKVLRSGETDTKILDIDKIFKKKDRKGNPVERSIGVNGIVKEACEKIKNAEKYYYVAIMPEQKNNSKTIHDYFKELNLLVDVIDNIRCAYWQNIEKFFENKAENVIKNFENNKGQIY